MIAGTIQHAEEQVKLTPSLVKAFEFLKTTDLGALADGRILAIEVVGEGAERVLGGAHVEGVHDDVGLAVLVEAAGDQELHVVGPVDFARAVDVVEYGRRVEDRIGLGEPGAGRGRDERSQAAGAGVIRLAHQDGPS